MFVYKKWLSALFLFFSCHCFAQGEYGGIEIPEEYRIEGKNLYLNGAAVRRNSQGRAEYLVALYLERLSSNPEEIIRSDQLKRVRMYILESVSHRKARKILFEDMYVNLDNSELGRVSESLRLLMDTAPKHGFKKGEWAQFDYFPGVGTVVASSTSDPGVIHGKDFYSALLKQWIGPFPVSRSLKQEILGVE